MDDESRQSRSGPSGALGRVRESLRGAGAAAVRRLRRTGEQVGDALGSAADRLKESDTGERLNAALEVRRVIRRAEAAHARGNPSLAYRLLEQELQARPADERLCIAFWRTCVALDRGAEAAEGILRAIRARAAEGQLDEAASLWCELVDVVPEARPDASALVRIVPGLLESAPERAVQALRASLHPETPGMTPGLAMRVVELARALDPPAALRAARVALASPDLVEQKRAKLEDQVAALEAEIARAARESQEEGPVPADAPPPPPERAPARDVAVAVPAEAPVAEPVTVETDDPDEELWDEPGPLDALETEAIAEPVAEEGAELLAALEAEATAEPLAAPVTEEVAEPFAELVVEETAEPLAELVEETVDAFAPATRFTGVKVMEATPHGIDDVSVELAVSRGRNARLEHAKIQAVAVAEVGGLAEEPVVLIDLVLNWHAEGEEMLRVVRLRSDRFDTGPLEGGDPQILRSFLASLLSRSEAVPLPTPEAALGDPFTRCADLDAYQRDVLQAG